MSKYLCPVCEEHEFEYKGDFDNCPICDWENDSIQADDHNYWGGANDLSVNDYRKAWLDKQHNKQQ